MSQIVDWLGGGDLRSDGASDQVVDFVLDHEEVFGDLYACLSSPDDVVRGRAADALEKIARAKPDLVFGQVAGLIEKLGKDSIPMVRWHLVMALGHLLVVGDRVEEIGRAILRSLHDPSVFVRSWVIVGLCIFARVSPEERTMITQEIARLKNDDSIAIRSRVRKALPLLMDEKTPFPKGWIKSPFVEKKLGELG